MESAPREMSEQLCRAFTFDMVAEPSVTGTLGEANFGPWLAAYLRKQACFAGKAEIWSFPVAEGDARHVVAMLLRGAGTRTVVLTGHYDTVTVEDYGDLAPLAGQPEPLRAGLLARLGDAVDAQSKRVREDLSSGAFLPGRGLLDMKGGLAAGLAAIAQIAEGSFDGNLLFIAVPDEENASAGARAAAVALPGMAAVRGLDVVAAINLDAIADDGDGVAGRVLALGTVGKVLPTALVIGRAVHSGFALRGLNAAVLAGAIAARLEWAPELTDDTAGVPGTAASLLSMKDGKGGYDVTVPGTAFLFWNVLLHRRSPAEVLAMVQGLAALQPGVLQQGAKQRLYCRLANHLQHYLVEQHPRPRLHVDVQSPAVLAGAETCALGAVVIAKRIGGFAQLAQYLRQHAFKPHQRCVAGFVTNSQRGTDIGLELGIGAGEVDLGCLRLRWRGDCQ